MEFSSPEYWSGYPLPSLGDLPNPGLPHCRQILYQLSHKGSPRILEWVAYSFSRASSRPRNQTRISCIAGGFFTNWAIREAHTVGKLQLCPSFCDPMICSLPGSSDHGILQAKLLEWVTMPLPGDHPNPGIQPTSLCLLHWQAGSLPPSITWEATATLKCILYPILTRAQPHHNLGFSWVSEECSRDEM